MNPDTSGWHQIVDTGTGVHFPGSIHSEVWEWKPRFRKAEPRKKPHLELCNSVYQHQVSKGNHFHLEQPQGSELPDQDEVAELRYGTLKALFDMCQLGHLRLPADTKYLRKRTQLRTTSRIMHQGIHQQLCQGQHEHQQIAGQTNINGTRQNISTYAGKYTNRFARTVAKLILHGNNVGEDPLIVEELLAGFEGVPGRKRQSNHRETVMDSLQLRRRRCAFKQSTPIAFQRTDVGVTWEKVFTDLGKVTPRVGTMSIERGELFEEIQKLSHPIQVKLIVTCRGTERFRVPKRTIPKEDMPWRRTLYVNRADGTIVDAGLERWTDLTKAQQVRKAGPARLSLTIFGQKREPSQSSDPRAGNEAISELPGLTLGRSPEKDLGWAPPPIALSGPQFRDLAADEREGIRRLHNNLGHPDPQMFAKFLKERGSESRIVEGALQYQCSTCAESKPAPVAARPSSIHKDLDFNDVVGADGAHWQGQSGETFHFMHFLDESTLFHVGAVRGRTVQEQIRTFEDTWLLWAGPCKTLYLDPAGEYVNDTWATYLQSEGIKVEMSAGESPWQLGRCERHGKIVKDMLTRMDKEQKIEGEQEFKRCLRQIFAAKNALSRIHGFTPEQALLGKARAVPASIVSDSEVASHSLAESDTPEGIRFRQDLLRREQARRSFISADNDSSFRRALLRRSRPSRLHYEMGDWVLYWRKQKGNDRNERGRWHGPAQVITNEKDKVIWMSHCGRLIRASPEQIRPASLREFQCLPRDEEGRVRDERLIQGQGPRSFEILEGVPDVSGDVEMDARTDSYEPSETLGTKCLREANLNRRLHLHVQKIRQINRITNHHQWMGFQFRSPATKRKMISSLAMSFHVMQPTAMKLTLEDSLEMRFGRILLGMKSVS